jgi:DNA transformation protein and related proteins
VPAADLLNELFAPVGGVTIKRMFGGLGVFKGGLMFALVADDVLYFKADATSAPGFEAEGFHQWVYDGHKRPVAMPYWQAPDRLYDDPDQFVDWARTAFAVAERTKKQIKKQTKKRKAARKGAA